MDSTDLQSMNSANNLNVSPGSKAVVSIDAESTYQTATTADSSSGGSLMGWIYVGILICIAIIVWKISNKLFSDIQKMHRRMNETDKEISNALQTIETLKDDVTTLKSKFLQTSKYSIHQTSEPVVIAKGQEKKDEGIARVTESQNQIQIKYATLQSPDENGILRFSERSMIDTPSPQKMFLVEIDIQSGVGTYRINPLAMNLILGDLQMFQDFVKAFTFSGVPINATIQDKSPGKISRRGNFWVVEELLEIIM